MHIIERQRVRSRLWEVRCAGRAPTSAVRMPRYFNVTGAQSGKVRDLSLNPRCLNASASVLAAVHVHLPRKPSVAQSSVHEHPILQLTVRKTR
jgi:hypothetical protein